MGAFDDVAEARIREAIAEGAFRNLPGLGRPLVLSDRSHVPAELRAAYGVLENAGCLPEEAELRKSLVTLRELIDACDDEDETRELRRREARAAVRLELLVERRCALPGRYRQALAQRLGR